MDVFDMAFNYLFFSMKAGARMRNKKANTDKIDRFQEMYSVARQYPDLTQFLVLCGFFFGVFLCLFVWLVGWLPALIAIIIIVGVMKFFKLV